MCIFGSFKGKVQLKYFARQAMRRNEEKKSGGERKREMERVAGETLKKRLKFFEVEN